MKHTIDLSAYQVRTDLAIDVLETVEEKKGMEVKEYNLNNIKVTKIVLDEDGSQTIHKKPGHYITIEFEDVSDYQNREEVKKVFANHLKELLKQCGINEDASCLIVGLGNEKSTPDALGPLTIHHVLVTNHLFMLGVPEEGFRPVSAIIPGVTGETGIETSDLLQSVIRDLKPDFVLAIDALASQAISRVNKTIQMSDTGIHPGSGVGNSRKEVSRDTVGVPVIAIGVPTVVDAVTVVSDTIAFMHRFYAFQKDFVKNPMSKMVTGGVNYLEKEVQLEEEEKKKLFGIIGNFNESEVKELIHEVLTPIGYNLMVTPKEVDFMIENLSDVIGNGINRALHENVNHI